jgi:hypothetical protein
VSKPSDMDLMAHADGEHDSPEVTGLLEKDDNARKKIESLRQMHEVVRGHLEMSADAIPERRFETMWREVGRALDVEAPVGVFARMRSWFDRHRGHVLTGFVSAGAVAALALILRGDGADSSGPTSPGIDVQPAALRAPPVIEDLETPGGNSTVLNIEDDDGHTTVIVVTPEDTVEGI